MKEVLFGEILGPEDVGPEEETKRSDRVRRRFFKTFRKAARYIPFSEELVASYYCALDPQTPHRVRGMLLAALAYFVLPTDTVPDFLVGIGFGDDAAVLLATITLVRAHITPAHLAAARRALSEGDTFSTP